MASPSASKKKKKPGGGASKSQPLAPLRTSAGQVANSEFRHRMQSPSPSLQQKVRDTHSVRNGNSLSGRMLRRSKQPSSEQGQLLLSDGPRRRGSCNTFFLLVTAFVGFRVVSMSLGSLEYIARTGAYFHNMDGAHAGDNRVDDVLDSWVGPLAQLAAFLRAHHGSTASTSRSLSATDFEPGASGYAGCASETATGNSPGHLPADSLFARCPATRLTASDTSHAQRLRAPLYGKKSQTTVALVRIIDELPEMNEPRGGTLGNAAQVGSLDIQQGRMWLSPVEIAAKILKNEPALQNAQTYWIINRIRNETMLTSLKQLLDGAKQPYQTIEFDRHQYCKLKPDMKEVARIASSYYKVDKGMQKLMLEYFFSSRLQYLINYSGSRNEALKIGSSSGARWTLPLDASCIMTTSAWRKLCESLNSVGSNQVYAALPTSNTYLQEHGLKWATTDKTLSRVPQLAFRCDACHSFDPHVRMGLARGELLVKTGWGRGKLPLLRLAVDEPPTCVSGMRWNAKEERCLQEPGISSEMIITLNSTLYYLSAAGYQEKPKEGMTPLERLLDMHKPDIRLQMMLDAISECPDLKSLGDELIFMRRDVLESENPTGKDAILEEAATALRTDLMGVGGLVAEHIQRIQRDEAKELGSIVRIGSDKWTAEDGLKENELSELLGDRLCKGEMTDYCSFMQTPCKPLSALVKAVQARDRPFAGTAFVPPLLELDWDQLPLYHKYGWENQNRPLSDRMSLHAFVGNVTALAVAHKISGRPRYKNHAGDLIRYFLLDEISGMSPSMQYADTCRSAKDDKLRPSATGFMDGTVLMLLWDAIKLLDANGDFEEAPAARTWARKYLQWLLSVELASEPYAVLYHAHTWDLQVIAAASFVGDGALLRKTVELALLRIIASTEQKECKNPVCPVPLETPSIATRLLKGIHLKNRKGKIGVINYQWPEATLEICFGLRTLIFIERVAREIGYNYWHVQYDDLALMREILGWLLLVVKMNTGADPQNTSIEDMLADTDSLTSNLMEGLRIFGCEQNTHAIRAFLF